MPSLSSLPSLFGGSVKMSAIKDKERRTWRAYIRYVDWKGTTQIHTKRGFRTKREAQAYEQQFRLKNSKNVNMEFRTFVELYLDNQEPKLKHSTFRNKEYIINDKILPYFGDRNLSEIDATDVMKWQNELLKMRDENNKPYAQTYLRTIQNQLSAIFNHACRYYGLEKNPSNLAGKMGKAKANEMLFWTKDEYLKFSDVMKKKPISFYAFEILYWTGIREGELLALQRSDFDLKTKKMRINKSYQRMDGKDYITSPKTEKSNRIIDLPDFLCREMEDYFGMLYKCKDDTRLFEISKSYLHREMDRGAKHAGVKRIRIHDLRHSHVAHLIELGFSQVEIAERLGHESITVTATYSHLYPSRQRAMADRLNEDRKIETQGDSQ